MCDQKLNHSNKQKLSPLKVKTDITQAIPLKLHQGKNKKRF